MTPFALSARDINLDEIYIKTSSPYLSRLTLGKLDAYQKVGALFVDRDVAFAGWISGDDIVYIREVPGTDINIVNRYRPRTMKASEIARISGVLTTARIGAGGKLMVVKRFVTGSDIVPRGETLILHLPSGRTTVIRSGYAFLDFSIAPEGDSVLYEAEGGFTELFPETGRRKIVLKKSSYADVVTANNPPLCLLSPDRQGMLLLSGGGGQYAAKVIMRGVSFPLRGITSAAEVFWLDNRTIAFRGGYAGSFTVMVYDTVSRRTSRIAGPSFNTNIIFSPHPKILTFLRDQVIQILAIGKIYSAGIEGEDVTFDPYGNRFTALLGRRLFVVNLQTLKKKGIELGRARDSLLALYRELRDRKQEMENEYSPEYIARKIGVYREAEQ